jgi:hypothetical protein
VFDATGHAFVHLMRRDDAGSFASYYGTYAVDRGSAILRIHVEGSNLPAYLATTQVRQFRIRNDTLTLGIAGRYQATGVRASGLE